MEPDHVQKSLSRFCFAAAGGDICNRQGGSTITDRSYWPNEARRTTSDVVAPQTDPSSAFASARDGAALAGRAEGRADWKQSALHGVRNLNDADMSVVPFRRMCRRADA